MPVTVEVGDDQPTYHSFLLRLWREFRHSPWRASLESAATGERHSFADLERLFAFLAGECPPPDGVESAAGAHERARPVAPLTEGETEERRSSPHPNGGRSCR